MTASDQTDSATQRPRSVFSAKDNRELTELYDTGAEEYDERVLGSGYNLPIVLAGLVCRYVGPEDGTLLDADAGTGLLGEILAPLGYKDLVAIDLSQGMLEVARKKGLYKEVHHMVLGEYLDFSDDTFAATIAPGVFNVNHAPPESLDELVRITRTHGYIIFSVRANVYIHNGFKDKQDALESEKRWRLVETTEPFYYYFHFSPRLPDPDILSKAFVYQIS